MNNIQEQQILKARALKLAKKTDNGEQFTKKIVVVEFLLIPEKYALPGEMISEVLPLRDYTPIPGTPTFVVGVINYRGRILSVINLKSFLHLNDKGITELNKVIVVKQGDIEFGILVDAIFGASEITTESVKSPPATLDTISAEYISGITESGLILLDPQAIINNKNLIINQKS